MSGDLILGKSTSLDRCLLAVILPEDSNVSLCLIGGSLRLNTPLVRNPGACSANREKSESLELTMSDRRRRVTFGKPVEIQGLQSFRSKGGKTPTIAGLHLRSVRSGPDYC
jgi:hypothetical protein